MLLLVALASAGCAVRGTSGPTDAPTRAADLDAAVAALQVGEEAFDAQRYAEASSRADSLFAAWDGRTSFAALADRALWLSGRATEAQGLLGEAVDRYERLIDRLSPGVRRDQATTRLVMLLGDTGREPEAVAVSLESPGVLDEDGLATLRQWVSALSIERLRGFAQAFPPETAEADIVHISLAQMLVANGDVDEARRIAAAVLRGDPAPAERELAEILVSVDDSPDGRRARIGAILPLSGELSGVGELLREGIELAVQGYREARPDGFDLEVVFKDDRSNPEAVRRLVEELESEGVIAIIGPLRSESFAVAARARRNPRLPILSPTAPEVFSVAPGAFTLYDQATRERDVAVDLGRWTVSELGLRRVGIVEPADPASAGAVAAFADAVTAAGGEIVARSTYDPSLTTFQAPIETVARAQPDVVFAPAPTPNVVLSFAPQLAYYGLDRSIVLGSEAWADPAVLRRLDAFASDHRVLGLWVDRASPGTRWQRFVTEYERRYRKSLQDNVLPGLSYDAVALVVAALEARRLPIPAALTAFLESGPSVEGVTGTLRPDPQTSTVRRSTRIRMLVDGDLMQADRSALLRWLAEARAAPPLIQRDPFSR